VCERERERGDCVKWREKERERECVRKEEMERNKIER
jgi:hypothetical protein